MDELTGQDRLIRVETEQNLRAGLEKAKQVLMSGGLVAFPTESFYGLAADPKDEGAIHRLFIIKKRQDDNPVLLLIPSQEALHQYVKGIPEIARRLIKIFWPGGLTMVFEASPDISPLLTAGTGKIGIRLSSHPVATELAQTIGGPITGTSANISGQPAPITAGDVLNSLGKEVDLILDGGETGGGRGSTILDVTFTPPRILRQGMVGLDQLKEYGITHHKSNPFPDIESAKTPN